jgi:hypothetical protein
MAKGQRDEDVWSAEEYAVLNAKMGSRLKSQLEVLLGSVCILLPSLDPITLKKGDAATYDNASDLLAISFTVISRVQRHDYPDRREGLHSI